MTKLIPLVFALTLLPALALADVVPPDVDACRNKALGDACKVDSVPKIDGTCQKGEHCSLKYSGCDSSGPCGKTCKETLKCKAGSGTGTGTGTGSGTTGGDKDDDGGCAVAAAGLPLQSIGFLLAGILLVVGLRRRG